jgi:hypothetical protein
VLDWRKRQQARASVRVAVEEELDRLPYAYQENTYWTKCDLVYRHVYDNDFGQGRRTDLALARNVVLGLGIVYLLVGLLGFVAPPVFGLGGPRDGDVDLLHLALGVLSTAVAYLQHLSLREFGFPDVGE